MRASLGAGIPPCVILFTVLILSCSGGDSDEGGGTLVGPVPTSFIPTAEPNTSPSIVSTIISVTRAPETTPTAGVSATAIPREPELQAYRVTAGSRPHDVAPAADGGIWYTAQGAGKLGRLDPETGEVVEISLGAGSAPHGVIVGPDGDAWVTDGGLNAIVKVDAESHEVTLYNLPADRPAANLNTASFDNRGRLWFTGQAGVYGRLDPATGVIDVWDAPRGRGPYGITTTPDGGVYYASLAGSYLGQVDIETGEVTVLEPPTPAQGTRRVWTDSTGRLWCAQWNAGQVAVYDPAADSWREWKLPGANPQAYAVYVDERDDVWLTDFGANAIHRFDPDTETFETFTLPHVPGNVRQLLGRPGEVWGAESGADQLVVIRF
jgi:virginiamycin B lyase